MNNRDNFDIAPRAWTTTQKRNRGILQKWCRLALGLQSVSGQWKAPILVALSENAQAVPEILARLDVANRRVIVRTLRGLQSEHLVERFGVNNQYRLTRDGDSVVVILYDIAKWQASRVDPVR